jgi:hypothetical protein
MADRTSPAEALRERAQLVLLRGDPETARRLNRLARAVEYELEAIDLVELGLPEVRRRSDAPSNATVGWFWMFDAVCRSERKRIGLLPEDSP